MTSLIFDIKCYAINDGPGIRITVFFKGCPLSCKWCHNPESQSVERQKFYTASKCIGSQDCIEVCPNNALTLTENGIVTDFETCKLCGKCGDACPTKAIEMVGRLYEVDELMKIIEREKVHIEQSGGGVTFSGGEPLMHSAFLIEILDECGKKRLHRTVDTSGFADTKTLLEVAKRTDLFLYDLKLIDSEKHKKWTGVGNQLILKNLKILAKTGANLNIRIPLIKNVNADEKELIEMAKFIANLPYKKCDLEIASPIKKLTVNLLPYHNIAKNKYNKLGQNYNEYKTAEPSEKEQNRAIEIFEQFGIDVEIGG